MRKSSIQWAQENFPMDYGMFDPDRHPCVRDILDTLDRKKGATVGIVASAQSYKTLAVTIWILYATVFRNLKVGWYSVSENEVESWAEQKFQPCVENIEMVRSISVQALKSKKKWAHVTMELLSASTRGDRQQRSLQIVVGDEAWQYPPGALSEIDKRRSSYLAESLMILPTTGGVENDDLHEEWKAAQQWVRHVPCPGCGQFMDLEFFPPKVVPLTERKGDCGDLITVDGVEMWRPWGGLHFETGESVRLESGGMDWPAVHASVKYQCPGCGEFIPYSKKRQVELNRAGKFINLNPHGKANSIFFHSNALLDVAWPVLAEEFIKASRALGMGDPAPYEVFIKTRLAKFFSMGDLGATQSTASNYGDYNMGDPWPDAVRRFGLIDVQKDHFWLSIRDFARDAKSRLMFAGKVLSESHLVELLDRYEVKGHAGEIEYDDDLGIYTLPRGCGIFFDGNYNSDPGQVLRLAARLHAVVLRGEDSKLFTHPHDKVRRIYGPIRPVQAFEGTAGAPQGADPYVAEIHFANTPARNRLQLLRQTTQPELLWTYPRDVRKQCPEYLDHLDAWLPVPKKRAKDSSEYLDWRKVKKRDDLFWCEKAAIVAASMANLIGAGQMIESENMKGTPCQPCGSEQHDGDNGIE